MAAAQSKARGKKSTNWFAVWITVATIVVVGGIAALVIAMNSVAAAPAVVPTGAIVNEETGAIAYGEGTNTVDTYIDFRCPHCKTFEDAEGKTIQNLIDSGEITLNVHPVAIMDNPQNDSFSSRAAGAMFAVASADPDASYAFLLALFANQPTGAEGLSDEQLVSIARDAGVNVTADLEKQIMDRTYQDFAKQQKLPEGATGTPTLIVNGEMVGVTNDPKADIVARLQ